VIRAVLFDFGGVLTESPARLFERLAATSGATIAEIATLLLGPIHGEFELLSVADHLGNLGSDEGDVHTGVIGPLERIRPVAAGNSSALAPSPVK